LRNTSKVSSLDGADAEEITFILFSRVEFYLILFATGF
jgi:hypothetical protein